MLDSARDIQCTVNTSIYSFTCRAVECLQADIIIRVDASSLLAKAAFQILFQHPPYLPTTTTHFGRERLENLTYTSLPWTKEPWLVRTYFCLPALSVLRLLLPVGTCDLQPLALQIPSTNILKYFKLFPSLFPMFLSPSRASGSHICCCGAERIIGRVQHLRRQFIE